MLGILWVASGFALKQGHSVLTLAHFISLRVTGVSDVRVSTSNKTMMCRSWIRPVPDSRGHCLVLS